MPPAKTGLPLASILRPDSLDLIIGQGHLIGPGAPLRLMAEKDSFVSSVIWGPPGTGKTTLVRTMAVTSGSRFTQLNATSAKVDDIRKILKTAEIDLIAGKRTLCFIDECLPYSAMVHCRLPDGTETRKPIGEIVKSKLACDVLSVGDSDRLEWKKVISWSEPEPKGMVEIGSEYGHTLKCSDCHPVYVAGQGYVLAENVMANDPLVTLQSGRVSTSPVKFVHKLHHTEPLFDIGVEDNHNFFADDVLVHNCHRFSKSQQDVLLPAVEDGTIILMGATTEKPKFAVNSTILSRCMVWETKPLNKKELVVLIQRVRDHYRAAGRKVSVDQDAAKLLINRCSGDARKLITALQTVVEVLSDDGKVTQEHVEAAFPEKHIVFDSSGNEHYDLAAAYQNCIQNSDADGAIYWLAKWIASGEDPVYICRRMMTAAFEDCATNPFASLLAMSAHYTAERTGLPECAIAMAQVTVVMCQSDRSKVGHRAIKQAMADVENGEAVQVPPEMRAGAGGYVKSVNKTYVNKDVMRSFYDAIAGRSVDD